MPVKTIEWLDGKVRIIDQTQLPTRLVYLDIQDPETMAEAIKSLRIRGAPAIGIAAAFGVVLGAYQFRGSDPTAFRRHVATVIEKLANTRPTAVNLFWALERMRRVLFFHQTEPVEEIRAKLLAEAQKILEEDKDTCRRMGYYGAQLLPDPATVLTHCNAGGLATADFGTALGVIYAAYEQGKRIRVFADETRPLLQGARLTAWELQASGIDVTVICDNMAAFLMQQGKIDCVLVGADRIARNGDVANKIGTYNLAVLAHYHKIPFYVVAPFSSFDLTLATGQQIPIEQRSPEEVTEGFGVRTAPPGVNAYNPAFDLTPHNLVTAIITEKGIIRPPFTKNIARLKNKA